MQRKTWSVGLCIGALLVACGVGPKKEAAHAALTSMPDDQRRQTFEATVRVLDEKPEFVDEFYAVAKQHPVTFGRFMANTTRDLHEPELAKTNGELLVRHPDSLEQTLIATTHAALPLKDARKALNKAMAETAPQQVDILTDDADVLARVLAASLQIIDQKPRARTAMIAAVRKNRTRIVALVKDDPELSKELAEELAGGVIDKVKAKVNEATDKKEPQKK